MNMKMNIFKLIIYIVFLFSINTTSVFADRTGFSDRLGTIYPEDPYFKSHTLRMDCPRQKTYGTYKKGETYKSTFNMFYNSNYFWAYKISRKSLKILIGFKDKEKNIFRIDGFEKGLKKKYKRSFFSVLKDIDKGSVKNIFTDINDNSKIIEIKNIESSGNSKYDKLCSLRWGRLRTTMKNRDKDEATQISKSIDVIKRFESSQFRVINLFSQNGYNLKTKFHLTDILTDFAIKKAQLESKSKVVIKKDTDSIKLAQQKQLELDKERALRKEQEKSIKIAEAKAIKLAKEIALAKLKADKKSKQLKKELALQKERELLKEKALSLAKQKAKKFEKERELAEFKAFKKANQLAKEKEKEKLIASKKLKEEEKKRLVEENKRKQLELKIASLKKENEKKIKETSKSTINLPKEWIPYRYDFSLQQRQFCQLTKRFFGDIVKANASGNEIKINMVHKERQENLDGLLPGGKVNNWIFKVVKIDQIEDGSAAVVLSLPCKSFVGSGQIDTKSSWLKKGSKEWRATIPYEDRRFRELAKLDRGQFIVASGILLEVGAFKPGQIETFYASQQIGEHPLTKGLNLKGELFIADLTYIAALN